MGRVQVKNKVDLAACRLGVQQPACQQSPSILAAGGVSPREYFVRVEDTSRWQLLKRQWQQKGFPGVQWSSVQYIDRKTGSSRSEGLDGFQIDPV